MRTKLREIGNSKGIFIPYHAVRELELNVGDTLKVSVKDNSIILTPIKDDKK